VYRPDFSHKISLNSFEFFQLFFDITGEEELEESITMINSDNDATSDSETDSDDDEVDEYWKWYENIVSVVSLVAVAEELKTQRQQYFVRQREKWEMFAKNLEEEKAFQRYYRMEKESFYKLKELTDILFNFDEEMSGRQTNWQEPTSMLHCTLRYLAGSSANDIRITCGI
jgi:hypothetical protein